MNIVVSDPKEKKAYSVKAEDGAFNGKKIGEEISLDTIGLKGFKAKITGGSDKQGFPMKPDLMGTVRKKLLLSKGIGFKPTIKGQRKRKSVRGNTTSNETAQLNLVITTQGEKTLNELLGTKKEEIKETIKEQMVKQSLESVGDVEAAQEALKIKGKIRR